MGVTVTVPGTGNVEKELAVEAKVSGMGNSSAEEAGKLAGGGGGVTVDSGQVKVSIVEVSFSSS